MFPWDAVAHYNLGALLKTLKRYDEAEKRYREAIRINSSDALAHNNLGTLLEELKRYDEAEEEYKKATWYDPDLAEAHYSLGCLLLITGKKDEAKQEILKARELFEKQGKIDDVKKCDKVLRSLR